MSESFALLRAAATADARVLGLIVGGSRGKGVGTERSDWDVYVVTSNEASVEAVAAALPTDHAQIDLVGVLTLDDFAAHALVGQPDAWNAYNFAHLQPEIDRTGGMLKRLCDEKEWLPRDVARSRAVELLDAYINSYYRSLKNLRDGNVTASRLDASEAAAWLMTFVFTAEARVRPYNKYLEWELRIHPLSADWWRRDDLAAALMHILSTGDLAAQAELFRGMTRQARRLGFGEVLDSWGERSLAAMERGATDE